MGPVRFYHVTPNPLRKEVIFMLGLLRRIWYNRRPRSANSRTIWWQLTNWDEVSPQVWYVNGEIVEV